MVDVRIEKEPLKAYNLTVNDFHTYFIKGEAESAQSVWVHNTCDINGKGSNGKKKSQNTKGEGVSTKICLLYTSPSPRDRG